MNTIATVKITVGGRSVTLAGLDQDQARQLSNLCELFGRKYVWEGQYSTPRTFSVRLSEWWKRFHAWAMPLLIITVLSATAMAQVKAVNPVRLMFVETQEQTDTDRTFADVLRDALRARRDVVYTQQEKRADYAVAVATERVTRGDGQEFIGYCAAVLVIDSSSGRFRLTVKTRPTITEVAKELAAKLDEEFRTRR